LTTVLA